jgi:hypothetical protein
MSETIKLKYRNWLHGQLPKRTKLDIDGWAGENTWKSPQPWHCKPFSDCASYPLELIYSWQTSCTVTCDEKGQTSFEGNFEQEKPTYLPKDWHPFASFAPFHFGYVAMVDIQTPENYNLMVMPHTRFYTDRTETVPCAVPGMLEMDWWPEVFFIVFKAPQPGKKLVLKHGDPIAQFLVLPRNIQYDIQPMTDAEGATRAQRQANLENNWSNLCTRIVYCENDKEFFDNKYKALSAIARRDGNEVAKKILDEPQKCPHWNNEPTVVDHREKKDEIPMPTNEEEIYDEDLINEVDNLIAKNVISDNEVSDAELEKLIASFKMAKRRKRQERSQKIKDKADPKLIMANQKQLYPQPPELIEQQKPKEKKDENLVLGHKIEKLL